MPLKIPKKHTQFPQNSSQAYRTTETQFKKKKVNVAMVAVDWQEIT